ncbi:unnamed protein product [Cylindrotheca closterium]|uniref:Uncharacterized protein n=1 Tax=Cylindrotheca closterium TaxID=2856 RepID=A0AAD2FN30_9STRA|nr:unnamed protein product [Cylindrotheca closterium]
MDVEQHFDDDEKVQEVDDTTTDDDDDDDDHAVHDLGASASNSDFDDEQEYGDEYGDEIGDDQKEIEFGDEYGDELGDEEDDAEYGDEYGDDEFGDEYGDEYGDEDGEEPSDDDVIPLPVGETSEFDNSTANPSSIPAEQIESSSDVPLLNDDKPHDAIPSEGCSSMDKDAENDLTPTSRMQEESQTMIPPPPVDTTDASQPPKEDIHVPSNNGSSNLSLAEMIAARKNSNAPSPVKDEETETTIPPPSVDTADAYQPPTQDTHVPSSNGTSNLSLAEMIAARESSDSRKESPTLSLAEMIAARSRTEKATESRMNVVTPTKTPVQSQSNPLSRLKDDANENDSSSLSLAQMIALRSSGKKVDQAQKPQASASPSILHLIPPPKDKETLGSSDQQDSSSMSLAEMIAARSQNGTATKEPTPLNGKQFSEPMGRKQSHVYKNRSNVIQQQQQERRRKPTRKPTNGTKRPPTTSSKPVEKPRPTAKAAPASPPPQIPCTIHRRQNASFRQKHHVPWRKFEARRRIEMRYRRKIVEQEWEGAADILHQGIASTKLAERIIVGFVKASQQLASDFKATSEDSVFNDSGKVVQSSFTQRRLSKIRDSSNDITGIFGSSSPILAACLECYGILAEQAETLEEVSRQISAEYFPRLREMLADLEKAKTESESKVKRVVEEFDRYENNTASSWDSFESLQPYSPEQKQRVESPRNITQSDGWFIQQSYCHAVLLQRGYLLELKAKMDGVCNRVVTLENYRLGEVRSILLDGFYNKQLELFQQLPLFENEMVKNMTDARIDEESLEEILHDRSKTRLKYSQSHRSSILNRSSLKISEKLESDTVPSIESEFGSPLESSAVLLATVVELQRSGTTLSTFVSVSWKRTLAVVLDTEIVCFLELPRGQGQTEKESVEDAFHSLCPYFQLDTNTQRKRQDLLDNLSPFLTWQLSKCSVDISNIQDKTVEVTEAGRRRSSSNLLLPLVKRGEDGDDNETDDGSFKEVETKYALRFFSAADASKWLGAFEKTKGKLHIASDESISASSSISIGTSGDKTFGTFEGEGGEDDDSNGTQDGSTASKSIGARDENGDETLNGEDGKLSSVSLCD